MPQSYSEPPIPPYAVVLTNPDSGEVLFDVELPDAVGTREDCADFIGRHMAPAGYQLDLLHIDTGRLCSYMVERAPRRTRLTIQDCTKHNP
jgi:hypothetical protein